MSPVERLQSLTRERLHPAYDRWLFPSAVVSVAAHAIVLFFLVAPIERVVAERPADIVVIEERIPVPPPPREPARPAEPMVSSAAIDEELTIPETEMTPIAPEPPSLVEMVPDEGDEGFRFVPRTQEPRCRQNCTGEAVLGHVPQALRQAGVTCALVLGLRIDTSGRVTATEILRTSGLSACDRAAESWARTTAWTTAYNRDVPVAVWIAQPIEVRTR